VSDLERYPFRFRRLADSSIVAVSITGDYSHLDQDELELLVDFPEKLPIRRQAELQSKYFLVRDGSSGVRRLLESRVLARHSTVSSGPSLFIVVPTLQCEHTCTYCQVSRTLGSEGYSLSQGQVESICQTIAESSSTNLTVEFQGGDPLIRFDLIARAISDLEVALLRNGRKAIYVVASTLHQLTPEICGFLKRHNVQLSTSIDGPRELHNANRPLPTRDSYERTVRGIEMARELVGGGSVAALLTVTRRSLQMPVEIVDEYVRLGLSEISLRPVSPYGFARNERRRQWPSHDEYIEFYNTAIERILDWNRKGVRIREGQAAIVLNKLLSPIDRGYVDLQSIPGAGTAGLVFNYDGYVYPSDEARMLVETGDKSLRLGSIGQPLTELLSAPVARDLQRIGTSWLTPTCDECAYNSFCGPDVTMAMASFGTPAVPSVWTEHCRRTLWLFDFYLGRLKEGDAFTQKLFRQWASGWT
jgi:His-Xaa-Ser system radical SAM maturase HxsB